MAIGDINIIFKDFDGQDRLKNMHEDKWLAVQYYNNQLHCASNCLELMRMQPT